MGVAFLFFYRDLLRVFVEGLTASLETQSLNPTGETLVERLESVKNKNLFTVGGIIVLLTGMFGYIVARITLMPLRNALSAQKQFIGNVAHELRTPLSIIRTNIEVSLLDERLTPDFRTTLKSTVEELDRTSDIINNLLSFSSFIRPDRIEFSNIDLSAVVKSVVHKLSRLIERRGVIVEIRKSHYAAVWGNGTGVEQIVMNILKNALMYTPRNGRIIVSINPDNRGNIELIVEDSGIGIARKDLFRIFEPFYRAEVSRARVGGAGSGLGLTIVSEIVKLHNGRIAIQSAPGKGTIVTVVLPCGQEHAAHTTDQAHGEITVDFPQKTKRGG